MNIAKIICTNTFLLLYTSKHRAWFGSWTSHCQIRATYIQALGADVTKPRHFRMVRHIFDILCFQIIYLELQKNPKKLTKETEFTCDLRGQFRISRNPFRRLAAYLCVKPIVLSWSTVELCDKGAVTQLSVCHRRWMEHNWWSTRLQCVSYHFDSRPQHSLGSGTVYS